VDGDLRGAVAATILNVAPGSNGTTVFTVQHHFVTQAGDAILVDQATATTKEVTPGSGLCSGAARLEISLAPLSRFVAILRL
jgi:hypothetical protein